MNGSRLVRKLRSAVLPLVVVTLWWSPASAQVPDHLKCYRVKDPAARATYVADLAGLAPEHGCKIRVPAKYLCVDTAKTNVQPAPPGGGPAPRDAGTFLCYALHCPRTANAPVAVADQFGSRTVVPGAPPLLCAPAAAPTTSTSTTVTTSTTTTTMPVCGVPDGSGFCGGPCPAGETCAATSSTTCGCVSSTSSCTFTSGPPVLTCGGSCPRVTDGCGLVFAAGAPFCVCATPCGVFSDGQCPNDPACPPGLTCRPDAGLACTCK